MRRVAGAEAGSEQESQERCVLVPTLVIDSISRMWYLVWLPCAQGIEEAPFQYAKFHVRR